MWGRMARARRGPDRAKDAERATIGSAATPTSLATSASPTPRRAALAWGARPISPTPLVGRRSRASYRVAGGARRGAVRRLGAVNGALRRRQLTRPAAGGLVLATVSPPFLVGSVGRVTSPEPDAAPVRLLGRVGDPRILHPPREPVDAPVDLAQALLAVEIVAIFGAVAVRRRPGDRLHQLRALAGVERLIFLAQAFVARGRDVIGLGSCPSVLRGAKRRSKPV